MDRTTRLLGTANRSSRIIEIGPSYSPIAPRSDGWNTHIVDHAPRAELRQKYMDARVNLDAIEDVDTVWSGGALHKAVPPALHGSFDTLIASHVIEHIVDPVNFLTSASVLLKSDGVMLLAVPDKRFCFDYFKPLTMTGDWLDAYAEQRRRHPLNVAWNNVAYSIKSDGRIGWGQEPLGLLSFCDEFAAAAQIQSNYRDDDRYRDFHAWHFTPASFDLIILELRALGLVDWRVVELHGPYGLEFFATLHRERHCVETPASLQARRMTLLRQQIVDLQMQLEFAQVGSESVGASPNQAQIMRQRLEEALAGRSAALTERDALAAERNVAISERNTLMASTSWRMTAPLRWFILWLRDRLPRLSGIWNV